MRLFLLLFRFVGRGDEIIKSEGNRISPTEIEEAVLLKSQSAAIHEQAATALVISPSC